MRFRQVVEVTVFSVVMALTAAGLPKIRTPGWWVASTLNKPGPDLNLGLFIMSAIVWTRAYALRFSGEDICCG